MRRTFLHRILLVAMLLTISWPVYSAKTTINKGSITIYVGEQKTFYHNFDYHFYVDSSSGGWFIRQKTGNAWSDSQEDYFLKIVSKDSQSCTIKGLADNSDSYGTKWELHCYGTRQSVNEEIECYWTITVKSYGDIYVDASPAGWTWSNPTMVAPGTKVYLTARDKNNNVFSDAKIYYTTDGSTATENSTLYTSAGVTINKKMYISAIASKQGYSPVTYGGYYDVTVPITNISLSKTSLSLQPKQEETLTATVKPDNATNKTVTWSSDKTNVATIDDNGIVKAVAVGNATITCKANDGSGVQAICDVSVKPEGIDINATNFPDENFRNYLLSQSYGQDGVITESEINDVRSLALDNKNISSLKGIDFFTKLNSLYCENNRLTSLDVSKNTSLTILWCDGNQLTSIDVSKNIALKDLSCDKNQLISLNLSKNTALEYLYCYKNHLTSLDVSNNLALIRLVCWSNQLTTLDVSHNTALDYLYCGYNQLTSLDVSHNTALTVLRFNNNQIKGVAMDNLISSLPMNTTEFVYNFEVIDPANESEDNICTTIQVAAVKAKGWFPCYWDVSAQEYKEYEGSEETDPSGISNVQMDDETVKSVFTLSGQRLAAPRKGINIIGGRKVVIK